MNEINYHRYFDWAATAPFDTQVLQESLEESFKTWGNPSSIYKLGTDSKNTLNEARNIIAQTLEVDSKNLFLNYEAIYHWRYLLRVDRKSLHQYFHY